MKYAHIQMPMSEGWLTVAVTDEGWLGWCWTSPHTVKGRPKPSKQRRREIAEGRARCGRTRCMFVDFPGQSVFPLWFRLFEVARARCIDLHKVPRWLMRTDVYSLSARACEQQTAPNHATPA